MKMPNVIAMILAGIIVLIAGMSIVTDFDSSYGFSDYNTTTYNHTSIIERADETSDYANALRQNISLDSTWSVTEGVYVSKSMVNMILSFIKTSVVTLFSTVALIRDVLGLGESGIIFNMIFAALMIFFVFMVINWFRSGEQ